MISGRGSYCHLFRFSANLAYRLLVLVGCKAFHSLASVLQVLFRWDTVDLRLSEGKYLSASIEIKLETSDDFHVSSMCKPFFFTSRWPLYHFSLGISRVEKHLTVGTSVSTSTVE